ncbi:MAG: hypothetical protein C0402_00910 [Thermodesulfovibrio sp.]|nr:hypothetical protein [Thermodesulfovibrio sp.]
MMKWQKAVVLCIVLLLGIAIGYVARDAVLNESNKHAFIEHREGALNHINPLLECDIADNVLRNRELRPFQEKVETFLKSRMDPRWAASVSIYFRELNDGLWFSIGDTRKFVPASLRKVPLLISFLKKADREGPALLDREVVFSLSRDYNADQNIKPSQVMVPGRRYTIRELLFRMIVYSDNNAFRLLTGVVDTLDLDSIYATLRIQNPQSTQDDDFLSVQTYASFFRVLYNATYLSKEASDRALELLSQAEFRSGLVGGVPPGILVSHKFGEHSDAKEGTVQLHDCGIVYYPEHPYILCVMSKGPNLEFLDDVIREVSRITYSEVDAQHRKH